ncbi:MAG: YHS domain-containing protein, partial [Elusimicrobiota bacterium]
PSVQEIEPSDGKDPVCAMTVADGLSHEAVYAGKEYLFCSTYCRDAFLADPVKFALLTEAPQGHTMRGIPTRMFQWAIAIILIVSFGLFECLRRGERVAGADRAQTADTGLLMRLLRWQWTRPLAQSSTVAIFVLIIAAGLFGDQNPATNLAPLLTWTIWWTGLVFLILYFGKLWCYVCPWDAIAGWFERLSLRSARGGGMGLGLAWPKSLRNIWPAIVFFLLLTWVELGMGITLIPRATAWVALLMLAMAIASALIFERRSFCRYACLVGRVSGLYALFSSFEVRARDKQVCASCKSIDCYKGNDKGEGCPTFEFPKTMEHNTYCIACMECVKTCQQGNIALRLRPWGADLVSHERPRTDEAILALALLSMAGFHGLT